MVDQVHDLPTLQAILRAPEQKLEYLHQELEAMKNVTKKDNRRFLADLKHLNPEKYSGPRGKVGFRQWTQDLEDLVNRYSKGLLKAMETVEYKDTIVKAIDIPGMGVDLEEDAQLQSAVRAFTTDEARAFINTAIDRSDTGLEIWRSMVAFYDPNNDNNRMDESAFIMNPGKAKHLAEVQALMTRWEDAINHRTRTLGKAPLDDDLKRSVLLRIMPEAEEKELRSQRILFKTFEALRTRVLEIVNERTKGPAAMMYCFDKDDTGNVEEEDGEYLLRIETRNGQKMFVKKKFNRGDNTRDTAKEATVRAGVTQKECFRCGKLGHIRAQCNSKTHANGGPPKEFRKKNLNSIEDEGDELDAGGLDICMLEDECGRVARIMNPFTVNASSKTVSNPFVQSAAAANVNEPPGLNDQSADFNNIFDKVDNATHSCNRACRLPHQIRMNIPSSIKRCDKSEMKS